MSAKRKIEIFSAGCATCREATEAIRREAGSASQIVVHDMNDIQVVRRAKELGVRSVPAVLIDGRLGPCCSGRGVDIQVLREAGLGR